MEIKINGAGKSEHLKVGLILKQDSMGLFHYIDPEGHEYTYSFKHMSELFVEWEEVAPSVSPVQNPKQAFGDKKIPVFLVPLTFIYGVACALYEGMLKYGKWNWRRTPVEASTYVHATGRHLAKWYHGENTDPVTMIHHLYNAAASLCILIDAEVAGTLIDDRPPKVDMTKQCANIEDTLAHLRELFKDHKPTHHTEK